MHLVLHMQYGCVSGKLQEEECAQNAKVNISLPVPNVMCDKYEV